MYTVMNCGNEWVNSNKQAKQTKIFLSRRANRVSRESLHLKKVELKVTQPSFLCCPVSSVRPIFQSVAIPSFSL